MVTAIEASGHRLFLQGISWNAYEEILHALSGRHLRIQYDRGSLEIMTLSLEHESFKKLLARLIEVLTYELSIPIFAGGSTTFRKMMLGKGLEPDECYWIQNEKAMRGKRKFDIDVDPPPDLVVEVDITSNSIDRLGIYAALLVPEVWRFDGETLKVHLLGTNGKYRVRAMSRAFPFLPMEELARVVKDDGAKDQTAVTRAFGEWVRANLLPATTKKNGKRSK